MKIQNNNKQTFELIDGAEKLGQISYEGIFSYNALATVGNDNYAIKPTGIFNTTITVSKDGIEVANMQMNWKGHIIISFHNGQEYLLKATGTFLNKFVVEDKDQQKLILFDPNFNWSKFSYNYTITYDNKPTDTLLVLLATYAANYYMAMMAASM